MIASLPMYDFPWTAAANDALWNALAARLRSAGLDAPRGLARGLPLTEAWHDPTLIFGQTCGYPYWTMLRQHVVILATPLYVFEGCDGPDHCSLIVARRDDPREELAAFRGARAAINARDSNSGMNLFRAAVAPFANGKPFFLRVVETGAHAKSLGSVVEGAADLAAIDCVTFALLRQGEPALVDRVKTIARSPASPSLPFIASATLPSETIAAIRRALFATLKDPALALSLETLGIRGALDMPPLAYARVDQLARSASDAGYPALA